MPRHRHAWRHVLGPLQTFTTVIILNQKQAIRPNLKHLSRNHQRAERINGIPLSILCRRAHGFPDLTIRIRGIIPRTAHRIHSIADTIILHQIHALRERRQILRERQRIPTELTQARPRNRYEVHLHVLESNQHGLYQSCVRKQIIQIIYREPEAWIHMILR